MPRSICLSSIFSFAAALALSSGFTPAGQAAELLTAGEPIALSGTHGKFDFLVIDADGRKLLAAHTGNASLDVIDLDQRKLVKSVPAGAAQSSAVDTAGHRYLVTSSKPAELLTVDAAQLQATSHLKLPGEADLVAWDEQAGLAYVGHDDGKELWVVDVKAQAIRATIDLPGKGPEDLGFDGDHHRLFQCMKEKSLVAVIDLATAKVVEQWPTAPAQAPHGMAMLPALNAFVFAGGNGLLVMMDQKDGHVLASTTIPARVDQIAYDAESHRIYCASGLGKLAVVQVDAGKLTNLGEVPSAEGDHSVAVDSRTHTVWIAYAKGETSYVQPFMFAKP